MLIILIPNIYAQSATEDEAVPGVEASPEDEAAPTVESPPEDEAAPTVESLPEDETMMEDETSPSGGGCLIATATYGSEMAPQVQFLREIRDNTVMSMQSGTSFMTAFNTFYYSFSPTVADLERQNPAFKEVVKVTITPLLSSLTLLHYVDIDTEQEMLGYGFGIILLNVGMYFVVPAIVISKIKRKLKIIV